MLKIQLREKQTPRLLKTDYYFFLALLLLSILFSLQDKVTLKAQELVPNNFHLNLKPENSILIMASSSWAFSAEKRKEIIPIIIIPVPGLLMQCQRINY
ncbi:hypothetical protein BpHYR1_050182 [Brachionus plicatilis]|uniref:Uncharacterized protein n=1 Tax=Brachionus plicatilis TaxID=10195 RepID=A0A3M7S0R5_BRAPC|nr:hypothetical protein BpHYR1_050182 [Brachionus plicatilis]